MDFWIHVGCCAATFAIVGFLAMLEAAFLFRDTTGLIAYCKSVFVVGFLATGSLGAGAYIVLWVAAASNVFQIEKMQPNAAVLIALTVAFAQLGRIEAAGKSELIKELSFTSDKESYYSKMTRMIRCRLYSRLIGNMPRDVRLHSLLMRGLSSAYSPTDVIDEYGTWANAQAAPLCSALVEYWKTTHTGSKLDAEGRKRLLLQTLVTDNTKLAIYLAGRRASVIVERQAFR